MVFGKFGAPLYEGFQDNSETTSVETTAVNNIDVDNLNNIDVDNLIERIKEAKNNKNKGDNKLLNDMLKLVNTNLSNNQSSNQTGEEEQEQEEEEQEEGYETTSVGDEEEEDEETTSVLEEEEGGDEFTNYEGFVGNNNVISKANMKLVLKAVMFSCLFYLLAHSDTRSAILNIVSIGKRNYLYLAMGLYFVSYIIINLVV